MHSDPTGFDSEGNAFSLNAVAEVSNSGLIERVEAKTTAVLLQAAKGGTNVDLQVVMQTVKEQRRRDVFAEFGCVGSACQPSKYQNHNGFFGPAQMRETTQ